MYSFGNCLIGSRASDFKNISEINPYYIAMNNF